MVRQHRWTLWIAGGLALLTVAGLIALALRSADVAEVFAASECRTDGADGNRECMQVARNYLDSMFHYRRLFEDVALALMALPVLLSGFVAGPLIARELETGTFKLSWTQSVSPARWLAARLAVPAVLPLAGTGVVSASLYQARSHTESPYPSEWHAMHVFSTTGTVLAGHVLFAALASEPSSEYWSAARSSHLPCPFSSPAPWAWPSPASAPTCGPRAPCPARAWTYARTSGGWRRAT